MATPALSADVHQAVADLFRRLAAIVGKPKFTELWAKSDPATVREEWAIALSALRKHEVDRGLRACAARIFAPNVGEFTLLCRPALDPEYAWHEAQAGLQAREAGEVGVWSHPAVWRAASAMQHELRTGSFPGVRKRWEMTLNREFAAGWGEEVVAPAPRIEHKPTLRAIPSDVKQQLADLSQKFNRKG